MALEYEFYNGQYVQMYIDGSLEFSGIVHDESKKLAVQAAEPNETYPYTIFQDLQIANLNSIPSRRTITIDYDAGDLTSDIVDDMVDTYLYQDGISKGTISTGIALGEYWSNDVISISDVLDQCASKNGFQWFIDKDMKLQFYQDAGTINDSTYNLVDGNGFSDYKQVSVNGSIDGYVNKIFIAGGNDSDGNNASAIRGDLTVQNIFQEKVGGTGIYGRVERDGSNVEFDEETAGAGTTTTNIEITGHSLVVGDYLWNITRDLYTYVTVVADANNVTVETVTGQTSGDSIIIYTSANKQAANILRKNSVDQDKISFVSHTYGWDVNTKLNVSLAQFGILSSYWNVEEVTLRDIGARYIEMSINAIRRNIEDFSTQKSEDALKFFKNY